MQKSFTFHEFNLLILKGQQKLLSQDELLYKKSIKNKKCNITFMYRSNI